MIIGLWFSAPDLLPGEVVEFIAVANHLTGKRSVGGQVTVTNRRLLFLPKRLDRMTGGREIEAPRSEITDTRVLEPGRQAVRSRGLAAALRAQLAVEWGEQSAVLVVMNVKALQSALTTTV